MSADGRDRDVVAFGDDGDDIRQDDDIRHDIDDVEEEGGKFDGTRRAGQRMARFATDRRVVPAVAGLAAVAAFGSLVNPWVSIVDASSESYGGTVPPVMRFGLMEIGGYGTAYVVGLLGLTSAVALLLFGPPQHWRAARVVGLALAGVQLGFLVAMRMTFDGFNEVTGGPQPEYDYGAGAASGFVALALSALALVLAGRHLPPERHHGPLPVGPEAPTERGDEAYDSRHGARPDWSWRPPRPARDEIASEVADSAPLDLTVQPVRPFARPRNDDDGRQR